MRTVLSLFNGISGCHLALDRAQIKIQNLYYAEIDKFANQVTQTHYPNDQLLGDVLHWQSWDIDWSKVDLVCAGFPCQSWSTAGKQLGDRDPRGALFWTTLEIISFVLKHNPFAYFMMENVKMKKDFEQYITQHTESALGTVHKILINSALVTAQNRQRYYWTNFLVHQPQDKGIILRDIIEYHPDASFNLSFKRTNTIIQRGTGNFIDPQRTDKTKTLIASYSKLPSDCTYIQCGSLQGRYCIDGIRQDHKQRVAGKTTQRLELRSDLKTNALTTVQKDNLVVYNTLDNARIAGITEDEYAYRPYLNDARKSGLGECGRILKITAQKTNALTASHPPNFCVGNTPPMNNLTNESITRDEKAYCLTANYGGAWAKNSCERKQRTMWAVDQAPDSHASQVHNGILYRKLTPIECERLQSFPDHWTACLSNTQRYKTLGNAWTVDVVAHIFSCIK